MKKLLVAVCLLLPAVAVYAAVEPKNYHGRIARRLGDMLPKYHVLQHSLDDEISRRAWTNLVTFYDYDHSVFLKSDLDLFSRHLTTIDDEIRQGNVDFGFQVYNLYVERLHERILFATNLLAKAKWDFSSNETYRVRRKDAPWPETRAQAEDYWRKRMKNEVLVQLIGRELDKATNKFNVAENLIKKYRQYVTMLSEPDEEQVLQNYLSAVCHAYDPHTDYMSPTSKEDFETEMNLTLCGVGAVLSVDDGALKIVEVMPGGPVDRDGRIKVGDKIVGVGQNGGEIEDVMWRPMRKTISKIRGPKGTRVTLEIIPCSDPTGTSRKHIELVRDEIKIEGQAATGRVERVTHNSVENRLGYVYLPGFYGSLDKKPGEEGYCSCAMDVAKYLAEFNAKGVKGLVLDLRGDGGGSLREAVMLSALFVSGGPVVQVRDIRSVGCLTIPPGNPIAFRHPMVVLVDRASASASEIVACHLRDTGRAIVLGDSSTHGKGSVQTVLGMGPAMYGSTKITTARFYRVDGRSTQLEGVSSDIHLPSLLDSLEIGEGKLTYALPFSRIAPADYKLSWNLDRYIPELKKASDIRLATLEAYQKHLVNVRGMKEISDRLEVSLEYQTRKKQMIKDREYRELDELGDDEDKDDVPKRRKRNEGKENDVVLDEAFRILCDLIRLNAGAEVPSPRGWWF